VPEQQLIAEPETKICSKCGYERPIGRFRFQNKEKGIRHPACNDCQSAYLRERRGSSRKRELKQHLESIATDPSNPATFGAVTRTEAIVKTMLTRFGGLEKFADQWFQFLKLANMAGKHHIVQRSFEAMLRLMHFVDANQAPLHDSLDRMTGEQLDTFIDERMVERLWSRPEAAAVVLEKLGWTLVPPDEEVRRECLGTLVGEIQERLTEMLQRPRGEREPAAQLLLESEEDSEEVEGCFDEHEFALFAAQETGESGGFLT
jgi:hypothetical protein